jgi:hypothetical protein
MIRDGHSLLLTIRHLVVAGHRSCEYRLGQAAENRVTISLLHVRETGFAPVFLCAVNVDLWPRLCENAKLIAGDRF